MIRKEVNLKTGNPLETSNKLKDYSSVRKETKSEYQKHKLSSAMKEKEDNFSRILNLEKNLPCSSGGK